MTEKDEKKVIRLTFEVVISETEPNKEGNAAYLEEIIVNGKSYGPAKHESPENLINSLFVQGEINHRRRYFGETMNAAWTYLHRESHFYEKKVTRAQKTEAVRYFEELLHDLFLQHTRHRLKLKPKTSKGTEPHEKVAERLETGAFAATFKSYRQEFEEIRAKYKKLPQSDKGGFVAKLVQRWEAGGEKWADLIHRATDGKITSTDQREVDRQGADGKGLVSIALEGTARAYEIEPYSVSLKTLRAWLRESKKNGDEQLATFLEKQNSRKSLAE